MRWPSSAPRRMVAGGTTWSSRGAELFLRRGCTRHAAEPWAMLASRHGRRSGFAQATGIRPRRDAHDAPEVPVQLALVVEADVLRRLRDAHPPQEQLAGGRDPQVGQVLERRQADLVTDGPHQMVVVA